MTWRAWLWIAVAGVCAVTNPAAAHDYFKITVVDDQTGRGVPMVELETTSGLRYWTDSNGVIAFREEGLMDRPVFFHVRSHGYEYPKDGFGYRGLVLNTKTGTAAQIRIKRLNIAERLYRITGQGIYADTIALGEKPPIARPLLNAQVTGQDSVLALPYQGKLYWFWGDTNRVRYPLGQFATSGATSKLPGNGGLDPSVGVDLEYFVDAEGFSRKMAPMKEPGLVWLDGILVAPDEAGRERLMARYARLKSLGELLEHGIMVFNDQTQTFEKLAEFKLSEPWRCPRAHPVKLNDGGVPYFLFPTPFPNVRVRADMRYIMNPAAYEAFTCLAPGSKYDKNGTKVERDPQGRIVWAWKPTADPITQRQEFDLITAGMLKADEAMFQVRDIDSGNPVEIHGGSVYWNDYLKRWLMIAVQAGGTSYLGEIWLAESPSPTGPWRWAKKVITHDKQTFYNPTQHPFFDQKGGRVIYFEGTYCNTFSGNPDRTPKYDYNQIMYRLNLGDERLKMLHEKCAAESSTGAR